MHARRRREALLASGAGLVGAVAAGALLVLLLPGSSDGPTLVAPAASALPNSGGTVSPTTTVGEVTDPTVPAPSTVTATTTTAPRTTAATPSPTSPSTITTLAQAGTGDTAVSVWPRLAHSGATAVPLDDQGLLLTTASGVGDGPGTITVQWGDTLDLLATVVGRGEGFAVLQLDRRVGDLTRLELSSAPPLPGSWVTVWSADRQRGVVVASDGGLALAGVLAANGELEGAPVVDQSGRLVGLCSYQRGTMALIPVVGARSVLDGGAQPAWLGISVITGPADNTTSATVTVADVILDGPADLAGVRIGDVIMSLDGQPVDTVVRLASVLEAYRSGESVTLAVRRDGDELELEVTLSGRPFSL